MNTLLSDTPYLGNLFLEKTISYVQKIGWTQVSHPNQNLIVFQRSINNLEPPVQLVLPSSVRFWDSSILLAKAINLLAASEDTSPEAISVKIQSENHSAKTVRSVSAPLRGKAVVHQTNVG